MLRVDAWKSHLYVFHNTLYSSAFLTLSDLHIIQILQQIHLHYNNKKLGLSKIQYFTHHLGFAYWLFLQRECAWSLTCVYLLPLAELLVLWKRTVITKVWSIIYIRESSFTNINKSCYCQYKQETGERITAFKIGVGSIRVGERTTTQNQISSERFLLVQI